MATMESRRSVIFNLLFIILYFLSFNVGKGEIDDWRIKVVKGDKWDCGAKFQFETVKETCKHKEPCREGSPGQPGGTGQKGDKGERGDPGEKGKCEEIGTKENPATSCVDSDKNENPYIFPPSPFKVNCDYVHNRICFKDKKALIEIDKVSNITKEEAYWLWPDAATTDIFKKIYGLNKSQISHLISISDRVRLQLKFHCSYFELDNNLQMLLWDNSLIGQKPTASSPGTYTVPEEENGCQNFPNADDDKSDDWKADDDLIDSWRSADILVDTWSGVIKNFYIPAKTSDQQRFYIQFKNICFYF